MDFGADDAVAIAELFGDSVQECLSARLHGSRGQESGGCIGGVGGTVERRPELLSTQDLERVQTALHGLVR